MCCVFIRSSAFRVLRIKGAVCRTTRRPHRPRVSAQVGEWLKPTDCKSVPPSEVRRFESSPVHHLVGMNRLAVAMIAYTKMRAGTLVILALFAVKSWTRRKDVLHPISEPEAKHREELKADR